MEVHHHSHSERKKFKHLAFEFFMLFLAVFCGFLAEYLLEHVIEHNREQQYISSLIRDVKEDRRNIRYLIENNQARAKSYDSLLLLLKDFKSLKGYKALYPHFIQTTYYGLFNPTDRTIQQLRNAGGLRLIRNIGASDIITEYYNEVRDVLDQGDTFMRYFDKYHEDAFCMFDYSQIDALYYHPELIADLPLEMTLISDNQNLAKRVYNKLFIMRIIIRNYIQLLVDLDRKGNRPKSCGLAI